MFPAKSTLRLIGMLCLACLLLAATGCASRPKPLTPQRLQIPISESQKQACVRAPLVLEKDIPTEPLANDKYWAKREVQWRGMIDACEARGDSFLVLIQRANKAGAK